MSRKAPHVEQFMSHIPHTIAPGETLQTAHEMMRKYQIRHLPVVLANKLVGLLSLRDLHLIETLRDVDPAEVPVEDAMSPEPYEVARDAPLDEVAAVMAHRKLGSAAVVDNGEIAGIFTTTDALVALLHLWKNTP